MIRYKQVRMPIEAYNGFMNKKQKIEGIVSNLTNKPYKITLTKVFTLTALKPIQVSDEEVLVLSKRKRLI